MCVSYWKPGASQHLALRAASWHLAMFGDQNLLSQQIHSKVKIQSKVELQNAIFTVSKLPIFPITSLPFEFSFLLSETFSSWKILIVKGATSNLSYASVISPFHLKKSSYYLSLGKEKKILHIFWIRNHSLQCLVSVATGYFVKSWRWLHIAPHRASREGEKSDHHWGAPYM